MEMDVAHMLEDKKADKTLGNLQKDADSNI